MNSFGFSQPWGIDPSTSYSNEQYGQQSAFGRVDSHYMPPPQDIPWNIQHTSWGMPCPQPQVVQFTGKPIEQVHKSLPMQLHCKRKSVDVEPEIPAKQFISEEKMIAHLNGLHLSNNFTAHNIQACSDKEMEMMAEESTPPYLELTERLKTAQSITLAEEIKNLKNDPLLPEALLDRLEKPCKALILWEPKCPVVTSEDRIEDTYTRNPSKVSDNKRGVLVTELEFENNNESCMDVEM